MKLRRLLKKEIYEIKKTAQDMKDEFNKVMEKTQKKESNRNFGNKKFPKSSKK
jgi:predicted phage-related endonuclease